MFFLAAAGLTPEIISSAAKKLAEEQVVRPSKGEMISVPRYRLSEQGREKAGEPVRFEPEFIPNPSATICVVVDEDSTAIIDSPRGLVLLDTSFEDAHDLRPLWGQVIALEYEPGFAPYGEEDGVYVGRLWMDFEPVRSKPDIARLTGKLVTLRHLPTSIPIGFYIDREGWQGIPEGSPLRSSRKHQIEERALSEFRMDHGLRVLGKVIGRLAGHL